MGSTECYIFIKVKQHEHDADVNRKLDQVIFRGAVESSLIMSNSTYTKNAYR